jgi:hypothetical protein
MGTSLILDRASSLCEGLTASIRVVCRTWWAAESVRCGMWGQLEGLGTRCWFGKGRTATRSRRFLGSPFRQGPILSCPPRGLRLKFAPEVPGDADVWGLCLNSLPHCVARSRRAPALHANTVKLARGAYCSCPVIATVFCVLDSVTVTETNSIQLVLSGELVATFGHLLV